MFGLFAVGEYALRIRSRLRRSGTRAELWSLPVVVAAVLAGVGGGIAAAGWRPAWIGAGRWPLFALGLALMAGGVLLRQWAVLTLGRFFTIDVRVHPGQTVVQRGPYRWVRHPSYSGLIVFCVGLGLALDDWLSLGLLAVFPAAGLVVRIRSEERALLAALGDDYRRYAAARPRLFPGIW